MFTQELGHRALDMQTLDEQFRTVEIAGLSGNSGGFRNSGRKTSDPPSAGQLKYIHWSTNIAMIAITTTTNKMSRITFCAPLMKVATWEVQEALAATGQLRKKRLNCTESVGRSRSLIVFSRGQMERGGAVV